MELEKQKVLIPNIFQAEALKELDKAQCNGGVVVLPTGTGKTFLASLWFRKKLEDNSEAKLLFICHNKDILSQANEKEFQGRLKDLGITYGYYNAYEKEIKQATFGTTQTLTRNLDRFDPEYFDYIIVDEAHHYQAKSFKKVLQYFKPKFMLGLTATPNRTDNKSIFKVIGKKVYEAKTKDAIKKNLLSKINYWCVDNDIDFTNIKWTGKKYDEKDLNRKICIKEYDDAIIKEYKETLHEKFNKKKTICFCATVEHVHRMSNLFNKNGYSAVGLTGRNRLEKDKMTRGNRDEIIKGFKDGKYDIIFVRDLFNEGVDIPDCDSIIMLRPTSSHTIFTQQIGRGLRKSEGKEDVLILDFTGNARKCKINFEVIGEIIGVDIEERVKSKSVDNEFTPVEFISMGCGVRLSRNKLDIINGKRYNKYGEYQPIKQDLIDRYNFIKSHYKLDRISQVSSFIKLQMRFLEESEDGFKVYGKYSINKLFGGWKNFVKENEGSYSGSRYSKDNLIKRYNECKKIVGRIPTAQDMIKNGFPVYTTYETCFDMSYDTFRRKVMKDYGHKSKNNEESIKHKKEQISDEFRKYKKKHGEFPSIRDGKKYKLTTDNTIRVYWGSYAKFIEELGGKVRKYAKIDVSKEDVMEDYYKIKKEIGRVPFSYEVQKKGNFKCVKYNFVSSVQRIFGYGYGEFLKNNFPKDYIQREINNRNLDGIRTAKLSEYNKIKKYPKEVIEKEYLKLYNDLGRHLTQNEIHSGKYKTIPTIATFHKNLNLKNQSIKVIHKHFDKLIKPNIKIIKDYKPITIIPKRETRRSGAHAAYPEKLKQKEYKTTEEKVNIREKIIKNIQDGDNVLLLESPELSAIKEIEKQNIKPQKIVIPNNKEFKKLAEEIQNYKTDLNIEIINTSILQYLVDSEEKFDFVWMDYCGAFSYYIEDLDILFKNHFSKMKLILTYNLFDPAKDDDSYYFTKVIDYVLDKISGRSKIRLINDITYRYKKQMYNIGFSITEANQSQY